MMPAYNFQARFVPLILDGSKPHTIRLRRKRRTREGDLLKLFTGQRTKQCFLIAETICMKVEPVKIYPYSKDITLNGKDLSTNEITEFALADGFSDVDKFFAFFSRYEIYNLLLFLEVIYWDPKQLKISPSILKFKNVKQFVIMDDPFKDMSNKELEKIINEMSNLKLKAVSDG